MTRSPLPFQGQKRNFVKQFIEALKNYPDEAIYIDLFGGSGLLSHIVKQQKPNSRVIYNDYDAFQERINNIPTTNKILSEIRSLTSNMSKNQKISLECKNSILEIIKKYEKDNKIDYITLSSSLLFSMRHVECFKDLKKETFFNKVRKTDYNAENYLNNVEIVNADYKVLFSKFKENKNVIFLVDPPYLSTDVGTYKNYWKLSDYLDVLNVLSVNKYFYFTSSKSNVIELCEWIESNTCGVNPFKGSSVEYHNAIVTDKARYNDYMLHKNWTTDTTF